MLLKISLAMPAKKTPKTTFGQRLYALRTQRGFTQMELAKALGTTQRVISYYETKGELPTPDVLVALVRTLGASADELLGLKHSKAEHKKEDPKRRRLWKRFRKMTSLPERDQRAVIRLINSLAGSKTQERASV
jgi:transcriptional regulator with XRE-family HTH domain